MFMYPMAMQLPIWMWALWIINGIFPSDLQVDHIQWIISKPRKKKKKNALIYGHIIPIYTHLHTQLGRQYILLGSLSDLRSVIVFNKADIMPG